MRKEEEEEEKMRGDTPAHICGRVSISPLNSDSKKLNKKGALGPLRHKR